MPKYVVYNYNEDIIKDSRRIDCSQYSLKDLEEILLQQSLFSKFKYFFLYNFESLIDRYSTKQILEFLQKISNSEVVIYLASKNSIKDQKLKDYLNKEYKVFSKKVIDDKLVDNLVYSLIEKYSLYSSTQDTYEKLKDIVVLCLKKSNNDIFATEKIIDYLIFSNRLDNVDDEFIDFLLSQYKEINLFKVVDLFLNCLFYEDGYQKYRAFQLLSGYLDNESDINFDEVWGLIFSQILAILKLFDEYLKFGDNHKILSQNTKINEYRVKNLMAFVKRLDYLVKHREWKVYDLLDTFLKSELAIKDNKSDYREEILKLAQGFKDK